MECDSCGKKFSSRRALIRHWRHFHSSHTVKDPNNKTLVCSECEKKYSSKFSLYKHKQRNHPNSKEFLDRKSKKIIECGHCVKKYSCKSALRRHVRSSHPEEFSKEMNKKSVECQSCGKRYSTQKYYLKHFKRSLCEKIPEETTNRRKVANYQCPVCRTLLVGKPTIVEHFKNDHRIELVRESLEFDNRDEFDEWRLRTEESTKCTYSIGSSYSYGDYKIIIYECSRSGYYQRKGTGARNTQLKGTRKIDAYCPAEIRVKITPEICQVTFTSTHVGHANELIYMRLNDRERHSIATQLSSGMPVSKIIRKFMISSCTPSEDRKRVNIVNADDVRNVRKKLGIQPKSSPRADNSADEGSSVDGAIVLPDESDDTSSVETWILENADSILYVKWIGEEDQDNAFLHHDDYAFVVMTNEQKTKLIAYGDNIVCVHDIIELPKRNFQLTALMVMDELERGYACAFLLSNQNGNQIYELFFRNVYRAVPALRPRILIAPVSRSCENAWSNVMPSVSHRLYNVCRVLELWRSYVTTIKNVDTQRTVYDSLKRLLFEPDVDKFLCAYDLLKSLIRPLEPFRTFFAQNYETCVERWAYCLAGVNASDVFDAFYHKFRYTIMAGRWRRRQHLDRSDKTMRSVSDTLARIRDVIVRQEYQQVMLEERRLLLATKLRRIRATHARVVYDFENVSAADASGSIWLVTSNDGGSSGGSGSKNGRSVSRLRYTIDDVPVLQDEYVVFLVEQIVEKNGCVSSCDLICEPCRACVHDYRCSCVDARLRNNMCVHIHLVCQYRLRRMMNDDGRGRHQSDVRDDDDDERGVEFGRRATHVADSDVETDEVRRITVVRLGERNQTESDVRYESEERGDEDRGDGDPKRAENTVKAEAAQLEYLCDVVEAVECFDPDDFESDAETSSKNEWQ